MSLALEQPNPDLHRCNLAVALEQSDDPSRALHKFPEILGARTEVCQGSTPFSEERHEYERLRCIQRIPNVAHDSKDGHANLEH